MDVVLEVHWSNSPIPISKLAECPDYIFDLHLGYFVFIPTQTHSNIIFNSPKW